MKKKALSIFLVGFFMLTLIIHPNVNAKVVHPSPSFVYSPLTPNVSDVVTFDAL